MLEDDEEELAEDEIEAALAAYGALLSEIGREDAEPLSAQPRLSYALGARIDVGVQVGQALLESRSERARLVLITEALEQGRHSLRHLGRARAPRGAQRQGRSGLLKSCRATLVGATPPPLLSRPGAPAVANSVSRPLKPGSRRSRAGGRAGASGG